MSLPEADRQDTSAIYRKLSLATLQRVVPQINWLQYLNSFLKVKVNEDEPVVAYGLPYFIEMGKILAKTDRRCAIIRGELCEGVAVWFITGPSTIMYFGE